MAEWTVIGYEELTTDEIASLDENLAMMTEVGAGHTHIVGLCDHGSIMAGTAIALIGEIPVGVVFRSDEGDDRTTVIFVRR